MSGRKELKSIFPIGVKYGQHRDIQEKDWDTDFKNMRESGVGVLRIHAFWGAIEPSEGKFCFEQYDKIAAAANTYGLKILFTLYLVSAPEWIFEKHPDSRFISANGTVWNANQFPDNAQGGWPGLCFDSEPFRETAEHFVKAFVEHFKGNNTILAIDIWHEPDEEPAQQYAQNDWRELMYCYCIHSVAKFRLWLQEKYKSLEKLNHAWTRHYEKWEQVQPPKAYGTYTEWLDWKNFRMDSIADEVGWLNGIVKKYDKDRATSVHCGIYEIRHPICSSNDHFKLADLTDMFACSMYDTVHPEVSGFTCDLMRSASKNDAYWIGETETGSGPMFIFLGEHPEDYFAFSRPADAEEILKLSWGAVARGAKGIMYWGWRPDMSTMEAISLGFTERDGELTERTQMLKQFTKIIKENEDDLVKARSPKSDAAILYHIDGIIEEGFASLGNSGNCVVSLKKRYYKDTLSLIGCYKLCMRHGIQPDFISREMLNGEELKAYKLLILPYSIHLTKENAEAICRFVENGGKVIGDGMCGFFTDGGWASKVCPPHGLDQVFGVKVSSNYELIADCSIMIEEDKEVCKGTGRFIRERLTVKDEASVAGTFENNRPAVVKNTYGSGRAVYIGTMFFAAAVAGNIAEADKVFKTALDCAEYNNPVAITNISEGGLVEVRRQTGEQYEFIFIINHSKISENPDIYIPVSCSGEITEICGPEAKCAFELNGGKEYLHIKVLLNAAQPAVYKLIGA